MCVCVSLALYVCVCAFRAASVHGPGHDTPGLYSLRCDHPLRDATLGRGLELALRGQLELLRLR